MHTATKRQFLSAPRQVINPVGCVAQAPLCFSGSRLWWQCKRRHAISAHSCRSDTHRVPESVALFSPRPSSPCPFSIVVGLICALCHSHPHVKLAWRCRDCGLEPDNTTEQLTQTERKIMSRLTDGPVFVSHFFQPSSWDLSSSLMFSSALCLLCGQVALVLVSRALFSCCAA